MKKIFLLLSIGFMSLSCGPQENPDSETTKPTVTTGQITGITATTATCSDNNVTDDGGADVTVSGVCWSTTTNPTIEDSKTEDGVGTKAGTGTFTSNLTGLSPNTTYFVRAYATNAEGTAYGEQRSFTTTAEQATPTLTTGNVTNISTTTATCSGNVIADGGSAVTARGVCWSTSQNPTTSNSKTTNGSGMGTYTSNVTGLSPNTTYYVRAYATNTEGTAYGEQRSFTTLNDSEIEYGSLTDSRDGNVYKTVTIGEQVWMAENLAYLPSVVGPATGSYTEPYYYVHGYDGRDVAAAKATENYQTYGVLYNWPAAMNGAASSDANPSGVQGVCPDGWHLPSEAEWSQLVKYLIANGYNYDGTTTGNKYAKSLASNSGWKTIYNIGAVGNTDYPEYRNKTGFTALPGGSRESSSHTFRGIGADGSWWNSMQNDTNYAWYRRLLYFSQNFWTHYTNKDTGYSVRCVRE